MKKLYTLLLALLTVGAVSARELTFYQGDTPITSGSTIYFSDVKIEDVGGGYRDVVMDPHISLGTDLASTVKITATCTSGQNIQMCAGGQCESGSTVTKNSVQIAANSRLDLQFEWIAYAMAPGEDIPEVTVELEAVDTRFTSTKANFTIVMGPNVSRLGEITKDKAVTWTPRGLEYDIDGTANISIYSITGTQVMAVKADGRGSVSTHSLRPGIYIYSVQGDGIRQTGKIQVK